MKNEDEGVAQRNQAAENKRRNFARRKNEN